jgi:ribosomal protein S18 acetylase RimI-like enzyme
VADLELAQAFYANYCHMWREVGAVASEESAFQVQQTADMLLVRSKLPQRIPHMILDPLVDGRAVRAWVTHMTQQLTADHGSLMVAIPPGAEHSPLVSALQMEGFMAGAHPMVAMAHVGPVPTGRGGPHRDVVIARTEAELHEARELLARVFGLPLEVFAFYTPAALVTTYLLRRRGVPVAALCLCPFAGCAGIYSVAVTPAERGRGYARCLVRQALLDALAQGMQTAVLSCDRTLVGLYRALGFVPCWDLAAYWLETWWR